MPQYRITIEKHVDEGEAFPHNEANYTCQGAGIKCTCYDQAEGFEKRVVITCHTLYTLDEDIPEWVREEVDANAIITAS